MVPDDISRDDTEVGLESIPEILSEADKTIELAKIVMNIVLQIIEIKKYEKYLTDCQKKRDEELSKLQEISRLSIDTIENLCSKKQKIINELAKLEEEDLNDTDNGSPVLIRNKESEIIRLRTLIDETENSIQTFLELEETQNTDKTNAFQEIIIRAKSIKKHRLKAESLIEYYGISDDIESAEIDLISAIALVMEKKTDLTYRYSDPATKKEVKDATTNLKQKITKFMDEEKFKKLTNDMILEELAQKSLAQDDAKKEYQMLYDNFVKSSSDNSVDKLASEEITKSQQKTDNATLLAENLSIQSTDNNPYSNVVIGSLIGGGLSFLGILGISAVGVGIVATAPVIIPVVVAGSTISGAVAFAMTKSNKLIRDQKIPTK